MRDTLSSALVVCFLGGLASGVIAQERPTPEQEVQALIAKLRSSDDAVRIQAVKALKSLGSKAQAARAALADLAKSETDADVRRLVASALKAINASDAPSTDITLLIERLQRADASVRLGAVKALKAMGPAAKSALSALTKLSESDPDADVKLLAKETVKAITPINVAEETAKTTARISTLSQHAVAARFNLIRLNAVRNGAQQKVDEAARADSPDLGVIGVQQNCIAVNTAKIALLEQDLKDSENEMSELEEKLARLKEAATGPK